MGAFSTHDLLNEKYAATLLIAGDVAFRPPLTCQTKQPKTLQDTPFSPHLRDSHERVEWESWEGAHEDDGMAVERHDGGGGEDTRYSHVRHPQPALTNPRRQYERLGIFVAQSGQGCGSRKDGDNKAEDCGGVTSCCQSRASWSQPPSSPPHISPSPDLPQPQPRQSSPRPAALRSVWRSRRWRRECRQPRRRRGPSGVR